MTQGVGGQRLKPSSPASESPVHPGPAPCTTTGSLPRKPGRVGGGEGRGILVKLQGRVGSHPPPTREEVPRQILIGGGGGGGG